MIDPPTPVGNIAATIQAPNLSITSGGQIQNVGNLLGSTVTLTGTKLINGITGNLYTPTVSTPSQVISLAPATSGGMSLALPNVIGNTGSSATSGVSYVINTAGGTSAAEIGPANLIAALPANLQPSNDLFYYNPQEQDLVLQQAALTQTGEASFVNCLSCSASGLSVADQDTALLYQNAVTFATANSIQLGTALTQAQIASLTQPILWYVEETVPAPNCTATGGATCPTVTALMPQVYLPPNYNAQTAEGNIEGSNVTLNFNGSGGSVLNTGNITASNTLTVNTPTLTNQQNSTNVGQIWNYIQDTGYEETTGTLAQPGGTMSAGNMVLNVQAVNQIGGALQQLSSDGAVNTAATQQLLSTLQTQLGSAFQQSTVTNDLQTSFVKEGGDFNVQDLVGMVAAIAISVAMGPQMFSFYNGLIDPIGLMTVSPELAIAGSALATGLAAGTTALAAGAASQIISTGNLNIGQDFEGALVSALSAGVTQGILGSTGVTNLGTFVTQATSGVTSSTVVNVAGQAVISAGVQTAIEGGSFLNALKTDAVQDVSADAANAIGQAAVSASQDPNSSQLLALNSPGYILAHAALGCAASAAEGTGCAGGAIGGATSALLTPLVLDGMDPDHDGLTTGQSAVSTAIATLTGAVAAGLAGANAQGGATSAENQAQNNLNEDWGQFSVSQPTAQGLSIQSSQSDETPVSPKSILLPVAGGALVVSLGTEATLAAIAAGTYDYAGDAITFEIGLTGLTPLAPPPDFMKSYTTGVVSGVLYPFTIAEKTIQGLSTSGKIAANSYNAVVAGTAAFGSASITNQDNPDQSAGFATASAGLGTLVKAYISGRVGTFLNNLIQGTAGAVQNAVNQKQAGK